MAKAFKAVDCDGKERVMAYPQLEQALAIAKTKSQTIAVTAPVAPQLRGKLAQIDPEGTAQFNREMHVFVEQLATALSQALTESPKRET